MSCRRMGTTYLGGGCERNERMKWCHEVDTYGVSELVSHSY